MAVLGIMIEGQEGLNWERWRRLCRDVEALGFDSLWRSDHVHSVVSEEPRDGIEAWTSLALAAEWTGRVEFGPLVSPMTFRQPALLARMAAAVDALAGGRLVLGIGAGWNEREHSIHEVPFPSTRERMDLLEHGIGVIRRELERALPQPPRRIPLLIGGSGERRVLRLVAEHADEWNFNVRGVENATHLTAVLASHCRDVGRDPASIRRSMMTSFLVGRDRADLEDRAAGVGRLLPSMAGLSPGEILAQLGARWPVGTPDQVAAWFRPYIELGVDRFMLQHFLMDDSDALSLLASEVAPAIA